MEKIIKRLSLHDRQRDTEYWLTHTPQERLDAVEVLRREWIEGRPDAVQGLQRVCRTIKRTPG